MVEGILFETGGQRYLLLRPQALRLAHELRAFGNSDYSPDSITGLGHGHCWPRHTITLADRIERRITEQRTDAIELDELDAIALSTVLTITHSDHWDAGQIGALRNALDDQTATAAAVVRAGL